MPENDDGRITIRMVFEAVSDLRDSVAGVPDKVKDHEIRIRAIEKYLWIWIGASGVAGAGISEVASLVLTR
jgi:hypothetical protein